MQKVATLASLTSDAIKTTKAVKGMMDSLKGEVKKETKLKQNSIPDPRTFVKSQQKLQRVILENDEAVQTAIVGSRGYSRSGLQMKFSAAPKVGDLDGVRVHARFLAGDLGQQKSSATGRNKYNSLLSSNGESYNGLLLNPTLVETQVNFKQFSGSTPYAAVIGMCQKAPQLAQFCKAFQRFKIRELVVETRTRSSTTVAGQMNVCHLSDPQFAGQIVTFQDLNDNYSSIANVTRSQEHACWQNSEFKAIHDYSRETEETLLYTLLGNSITGAPFITDPMFNTARSFADGALLFAQDMGRNTADSSVAHCHLYLNMVIDLYDINFARIDSKVESKLPTQVLEWPTQPPVTLKAISIEEEKETTPPPEEYELVRVPRQGAQPAMRS